LAAWGVRHGDPRLANSVLADDGSHFMDFATMALTPILLKFGDALRTWCASREFAESWRLNAARLELLVSADRELLGGTRLSAGLAGEMVSHVVLRLAPRRLVD
jgi:hypothetical protein